ncbi:aminotransferase class III-fold pyridoxal phosphate-dependent enzyme [Roseibium sp.]|uniref:aminotransferase class III-fold pyridoxal phosphate-dependent enzyme n=1 Tax=Roseibium sp. TaxID=1936156 RepID=UPI003B5050EC
MTTVAIIQARMGSTRLPKKVMLPIHDRPMIDHLIDRLSLARGVDKIVLATSSSPENDELAAHVEGLGIAVFRGSESDVLDRYYQAARLHNADTIVRITGDCPLVDAGVVDQVLSLHSAERNDYTSNVSPPTFPDGLDVEVVQFEALAKAWRNASDEFQREHVTPYLRQALDFKTGNVAASEDFSSERWTVDEPEDYELVSRIFESFPNGAHFGWQEILALKNDNPGLFQLNSQYGRNEGASMGDGQKLWQRAKRVIPGGNMLLSKRPDMFLPEHWPAYFSKAKGCRVWDLDGREYVDMSIMGIGTNTLGYGNAEIDAAVMETVQAGNMSTLNCPEEVWLAERLVELHPWADMVRFARSGGEANAIAIRIARAASGRDKVAICGYHGWHDWYLAANLSNDKELDGHLLPGLEPKGVPRDLAGSILTFEYNDFPRLKALVEQNDIGVIKMEVSRNRGPEDGFLHKVRQLASEHNIVLVFDECTSGFRETFGGLHKKFGVEPDMAMFGKALGNGYAITAAIGRREVMEAAQTTFISSTFWTERIGPSAGLKTLEVMEAMRSWEMITSTGTEISERWVQLGKQHGLPVSVSGLPALTSFSIGSANWLKYKTYITQEMLKRGFLASNAVYVCTEHTEQVVAEYFQHLDDIFATIRRCEDGRSIDDLLEGPVCSAGFKRLN